MFYRDYMQHNFIYHCLIIIRIVLIPGEWRHVRHTVLLNQL